MTEWRRGEYVLENWIEMTWGNGGFLKINFIGILSRPSRTREERGERENKKNKELKRN